MSKNERVKQLRSELKLSQAAFGKAIKISQRAIGLIESGINCLSPRNFELICRTWNVNPYWLETGVGEMFLPPPEKDFLDRLAEEKGLTPDEKALIGSIIDLPHSARMAVIDWAEKLVDEVYSQSTEQAKADERREIENQIAELQERLSELNERGREETPQKLAAAEQDRKYIQSVLDEEEAAFKRAAVPKNFDSS